VRAGAAPTLVSEKGFVAKKSGESAILRIYQRVAHEISNRGWRNSPASMRRMAPI
jgi:hypothetical protein